LQLGLPVEIVAQVSGHHETIKTETLATQLEVVVLNDNLAPNADLDGVAVFVAVNRLS
jgi:hypothetical protein